jgi:hypothetical protein
MSLRREKVTIEGVPGTWTTNLTDDDLRTFYAEHCDDVTDADAIKIGVFNRVMSIKYRDRMVPFKEGACRWALLDQQNWLIYRTTLEWEIWLARNEEIEELRDEQERERQATALLLRTESDHLMSQARAAVLAKDWTAAERHLLARADLVAEAKRQNIMNWGTLSIFESVSHWFASFPSLLNGVEFLKRYDCRPTAFYGYANHAAFANRLPNETVEAEIDKVFDAAISLFPTDGNLYKQVCLFWRRHRRLDLAIKFCQLACEQGAADDTKSGFAGRLKRLRGEQSWQLAQTRDSGDRRLVR